MAKILFHVLVGSENPTRACFPFLQAVATKSMKNKNASFVTFKDSAELYATMGKVIF